MRKLTLNDRKLLAEKLKLTKDFLSYFIEIVLLRAELTPSSIDAGKRLTDYLSKIPDILPDGFGFNAIIKIYNYAKDSGLDTEPGIYWQAWQAELSENTLAYCTHTHTIDNSRRKEKKAEYEYKFKVWDDGKVTEEDLPYNFEHYEVHFLHHAANARDFKTPGSWLSANITFDTGD